MAESCRGCGDIYLSKPALELLTLLGSFAFLPVGERDGKAVHISDSGEEHINSLKALILNGLVSLDWTRPLEGCDYSAYSGFDRLGSIALTARGQDALDTLDVLGVEE